MTCISCRWWHPVNERGQCRASLPVLKGSACNAHVDYAWAVWPETLPTDCCGHHTPKDALTRREAAEHVQAERADLMTPESMVVGHMNLTRNQEL